MSEFEVTGSGAEGFVSSGSSSGYELTGPPVVLPIAALALLLSAVSITFVSGDSVVAFAFAVASSLVTLGSRVVNQMRINQPSYSSVKWFSRSTTGLYVVASLITLAQVLMVAYVAGR